MAEETKATETKETPAPDEAKAPPKTKSFEELLAEFSGDAEDKPKKAKADDDEDEDNSLQEKVKRLRESKERDADPEIEEIKLSRRREEFLRDLRKAGGDGLAGLDEDLLLDIGIGRLGREPALEKAFIGRKENAKRWRDAARVLAADVAERVGKLRQPVKAGDGEDDEDEPRGNKAATQAAARAAARATETRKPPDSAKREEDERMMGLTNAQFIAELRKKGISVGL